MAYTEPGARGETSGNVTKLARLGTGLEIKVPLFIHEGVKVKVYTETRSLQGGLEGQLERSHACRQ